MLQQYRDLRVKGYSTVGTSVLLVDTYHTNAGVWFACHLCVLVWYYERHGCLPPECCGSFQVTSTVLSDSNVKRACCSWLAQQVAGTITPQKFAMAISEIILPSLDITLKKLLGQHTAHQWLHKLGYWHVQFQKGVYMDGHKCLDVVKYWNEQFLPQMLQYECCMTHFEGPDLEQWLPKLQDGELEIIALYHDECCFHALDFKRSGWCAPVMTLTW